MKLSKIIIPVVAGFLSISTFNASAFDIKGVLGKVGETVTSGNTITDMIQGVFAKSDLSIADVAGEWTSEGPAVSFRSENFLKNAGGVAMASTIESKMAPYYKKYGLDGAVLTLNSDGTFSLNMKRITLSGTFEKNEGHESSNFIFNFTALGVMSLGSTEAYVTKSGNSMDVMFDASKLQGILDVVAKVSKLKVASAATSLLNNYDGICIGFKMKQTGTVAPSTSKSVLIDNANDVAAPQESQAVELIKGFLGKKKK